ncbi:MAG: IucA/IucC family protein [Mycobacteriales bacterium]
MTAKASTMSGSQTTSELQDWARRHNQTLAASLPAELVAAEQAVAASLAAALIREGIATDDLVQPLHHDVGFARAVASTPLWRGAPLLRPATLFAGHPTLATAQQLHADVDNCVAHLATVCAVQRQHRQLPAGLMTRVLDQRSTLNPTTANLLLDQLNVTGHNVHPLGRLRHGMSPAQALRYAAECQPGEPVMLPMVAVRTELLCRTAGAAEGTAGTAAPGAAAPRHLGEILETEFDHLAAGKRHLATPDEYTLVPLHPWQYDHVLLEQYAPELAEGHIVVLPQRLAATPTTSLRTLATGPGRSGRRWMVKTALSARLTSTRRDISPATTVNGPAISAILADIVAADPLLRDRVGVIGERAGSYFAPPAAAADPTRLRGLSALLRDDLADHVGRGQLAVSASSLCADSSLHERPLLAHLVTRIAAHRGCALRTAAQLFLESYADLLGTTMVVLLSGYGIGLEAHLQNTVVVLDRDDMPVRLLLRDFAGLRVHLPRLAAAGYRYDPHPSSLTASRSVQAARTKAYYACLQANLAEIVLTLSSRCDLDAAQAWAGVWARLDRAWTYVAHRLGATAAAPDRAAAREPTLLQKAFVTMACEETGIDRYVAVPNPLHDAARDAHTVLGP